MAKEKVLSFVQARQELSKILDAVDRGGQAVIIAKRQKPVAAIISLKQYQEMVRAKKNLSRLNGRRLLKVRGLATASEEIAQAIRGLRKSRLGTLLRAR